MTKLEQRMKQYDIPPIPYGPKGKVVLVYRLPPERKTATGLHLPDAWTARDGDGNEHTVKKEPVSRGVLLAAGLMALDEMKDHLIELGDVVHFGRYAGADFDANRDPENAAKAITQMKIEDINGSEDQPARAAQHDLKYDDESGQHYYEQKTNKRKVA